MKAKIEQQVLCAVQYENVFDNSQYADLSYSLRDPFAVVLTVLSTPWVFARDLLSGDVQGIGDVHVGRENNLVTVTLGAQYTDSAQIHLDELDVAKFLIQTYSLCPPGNEWYDIDRWIAKFEDEKSCE